ncbi:MAG TPA: metal-dependent hydrolase [Pyrinomonadaceae bacterium]|jgi:L-ascorbate metabolism protein UlaG (beta-lactamase superfamily)
MKTKTARILLALLLAAASVCNAEAQATKENKEKNDFQITWLGHAAFEVVSTAGTRLLIDPFLKENPATPAEFKDLSRYKPTAILLTHSHGDHLGDAITIAKASGAKIVSVNMPQLFQREQVPEAQIQTINVGGTITIGDVRIHVVPAMHGSEPSGRPVGFVLEFADGRSVYHQGDTWIFGDMALIQEFYHPTVILLNVGGRAYGQSPEVAMTAVGKYFKPQIIIPMHYASLPTMSTEAEVRAVLEKDRRVLFMKPGQTKTF